MTVRAAVWCGGKPEIFFRSYLLKIEVYAFIGRTYLCQLENVMVPKTGEIKNFTDFSGTGSRFSD